MSLDFRSATATARPALSLPEDEVHVWAVPLERAAGEGSELTDLLSQEERARADRFKSVPARGAYIECRGTLRLILSRYTGDDPRAFVTECGAWGKPRLSGDRAGSIRFNVSHSHELGLIACSRGREVGVDLERVRCLPDAEEIARRHFSPEENRLLQALPARQRTEGFFRCWTRKEAFAKATGRGLSLPMDQYIVAPIPGATEGSLQMARAGGEVSWWRFVDLPDSLFADGGYVGTLAAEGRDWRMVWQDSLHS